jgi:hypothetical protein
MTHLQFPRLQQGTGLRAQIEKAQQVTDRAARAADGVGGLLVGELEFLDRTPRASSSGFRSSRWIFSISAMAMAAESGISRTTTGTCSRPAICAARQRRSPAIIS